MIKKLSSPYFFILIATCLIFFKIFLFGLYPIPGDLLVSFYFPWYSGGWESYNSWTTHKELFDADAIRQIYPWREFAMDQFKKGQIPLWNPYAFSGQPLLANFQSGVFYPLNLLYFLTDSKNAWLLLVVLQPFLGGIFMYLAIRSFKVSKIASTFGAVAFMYSSYLITWMENVNIAHSYIYLPLVFFGINRFHELKKTRYLLLLTLSLTLSILAGHPQTAIYVYMSCFVFWVYKYSVFNKNSLKIAYVFVLSLALSAIQIIPTYSFYKDSPISLPFSSEVFDRSILPFQNLITFFASDFYGNPAANNFWSQTYGDFTPYFGVVPLIFSLWAVKKLWSRGLIKFLSLTSIIFIVAALPGPITYLIKIFKIPLLNSTTPSRFICISIFTLIILSAFGLEEFLSNLKNKKYQKDFLKFMVFFVLIYLALWAFALLGPYVLTPKEVWQTNLKVTARNLVLPTSMVLVILTLNLYSLFKKPPFKSQKIPLLIIFATTLLGGLYFTNKFLPSSPKSYIFPDHLVFSWLKQNAGLNRFYGQGTAHIDFNFPAHFQVFGSEGYDTLRFQRYAQLLASGFDGKIPDTYLRSDAVFATSENGFRSRLFDLLGVKYLLDKEDNPKTGADWHYERFPNDKITGLWQSDKFQIYERQTVLPRIFLTGKYVVASTDSEIIDKIYDRNFNLETLILEQPPQILPDENQEISIPQIVSYEPNSIKLHTKNEKNSLLFISDAYSSDWKAKIDNNEVPILRANYALRSIAVASGDHTVTLEYKPRSFAWGLSMTIGTLIFLIVLSSVEIKKKKF